MTARHLDQWLEHIEHSHPRKIDLGLDRVSQVYHTLDIKPVAPLIITVAGTNGKGSTLCLMSRILRQHGFTTGCYTSPHLVRYNERICINDAPTDDHTICAAFERIEVARGELPLTYFEYSTLAALVVFAEAKVDVAILEVGLGGRLDAVNMVDPDLSVITTIDFDHQDWLGDTREAIGFEKAGIFRTNTPAVCGDPDTPRSITEHAETIGAPLLTRGADFDYRINDDSTWRWQGAGGQTFEQLPLPQLPIANAATTLQALVAAGVDLKDELVRQALNDAQLSGRYQRMSQPVPIVLDVAHNAQSAAYLAKRLNEEQEQVTGKLYALVGMLADKDSDKILRDLTPLIDCWCVTQPISYRALPADDLAKAVSALGAENIRVFSGIADSLEVLTKELSKDDLLVIFGSFYTVGEALSWLKLE